MADLKPLAAEMLDSDPVVIAEKIMWLLWQEEQRKVKAAAFEAYVSLYTKAFMESEKVQNILWRSPGGAITLSIDEAPSKPEIITALESFLERVKSI